MSATVTVKTEGPNYLAYIAKVRSSAADAALLVGRQIAYDSVTQAPRPPIKWGVLRGSVSVVSLFGATVRVSFRTAYALLLHEVGERIAAKWPSKEIDPESGPKWLSSKVFKNRGKYNKLAAKGMGRKQ